MSMAIVHFWARNLSGDALHPVAGCWSRRRPCGQLFEFGGPANLGAAFPRSAGAVVDRGAGGAAVNRGPAGLGVVVGPLLRRAVLERSVGDGTTGGAVVRCAATGSFAGRFAVRLLR